MREGESARGRDTKRERAPERSVARGRRVAGEEAGERAPDKQKQLSRNGND